ncbi:MAG: PH domain-containing protein [Vulcanisaeta sp.]
MSSNKICVRPIIKKTLIKGTILLAVITPFLEITPSRIINYAIFVVIWYVLLIIYILWKRYHEYCIHEGNIIIKNPLSTKKINKSQISDCFISQGFLARRFNCGSIYVITTQRKVYMLRDIPRPDDYYNIVCKEL